jgi:NADH-quinone oxidoreductase subunit C/D
MGANTTLTTDQARNADSVAPEIVVKLQEKFGADAVSPQSVSDGIPTFWASAEKVRDILRHLKGDVEHPYRMLYDITAIDERERVNRQGQPPSDFSVVYHLFSYDRNAYIRAKVPLEDARLSVPTVTDLWPAANWYEREVWDMFGIRFEGHPDPRRLLMYEEFVGHPLRKDYPINRRQPLIGPAT